MNLKNKKAFTLIELLVVIAILAILAAISIPSVMGLIQDAQNSAIAADMRSIHVQAIRVNLTTGSFDTVRCTGTPIDNDIAAMCASIDRVNGAPDGNVISHTSANAFCIQSPLHGGGFRCTDHNGHWGIAASHCGNAAGTGIITEAAATTGAQDLTLNIDSIAITLTAGWTLDQVGAHIATTINGSAGRTINVVYDAAINRLTFTSIASGTDGNRIVAMTNGAYRTELDGRLGTVPSISMNITAGTNVGPALSCR